MDEVMDVGIEGLALRPGHHICALYDSDAARDRVLVPYLRAGLRAGHRCVAVLDAFDADGVLAGLGEPDEVTEWRSAGLLELQTPVPERDDGSGLSVDEMIAMWDGAVGLDTAATVRASGESTWWLSQVSEEGLITYEAELNRRIPDRLGVLCMYDLRRFGAQVLIDAVRSHPMVLVDGLVVENPHYLNPEQLVALVDADPRPELSEHDLVNLLA